jgi:aspartate kinase
MGELMSALIFAALLEQNGQKSRFVDSAEVVTTDDKFGNASPDFDSTKLNATAILLPMVEKDIIPVTTGFRGATADKRPTTLGRGGSDFSATILGSVLSCDEVWIWTDVDGVLTADPRICPDATTLPEVTYTEAMELSYYGAKVIHPKAIVPVMERGIPVWIKNSFRPELTGTKIVPSVLASILPVKSVSAVPKAALITLSSRHDVNSMELFGRLFLRLGHEHIDILFSTQSSSENALGLVLRDEDMELALSTIKRLFKHELKHGIMNKVAVQRDVGVVAVLGQSMKGVHGILARLFTRVNDCKVSVIAVAQGASELNICFAVPAVSVPDVVRAVHEEFLGARHLDENFSERECVAPDHEC